MRWSKGPSASTRRPPRRRSGRPASGGERLAPRYGQVRAGRHQRRDLRPRPAGRASPGVSQVERAALERHLGLRARTSCPAAEQRRQPVLDELRRPRRPGPARATISRRAVRPAGAARQAARLGRRGPERRGRAGASCSASACGSPAVAPDLVQARRPAGSRGRRRAAVDAGRRPAGTAPAPGCRSIELGHPARREREQPPDRSATSTTSHSRVPIPTSCRRPVPCPAPSAAAPGAELGGERGTDLEQVADHEQVRDLGDRRVRVPVDRDDRLRTLHARRGAASRPTRRGRGTGPACTTLPVWPIWRAYGIQPASTDARRGADHAAQERRPAPRRGRSPPGRRRRGRRRRRPAPPRATPRHRPRRPGRGRRRRVRRAGLPGLAGLDGRRRPAPARP